MKYKFTIILLLTLFLTILFQSNSFAGRWHSRIASIVAVQEVEVQVETTRVKIKMPRAVVAPLCNGVTCVYPSLRTGVLRRSRSTPVFYTPRRLGRRVYVRW